MTLEDITQVHQIDLKNSTHPSAFFEHNEYKLLIYRLFDDTKECVNVQTHHFIITKSGEIYKYDKDFITIPDTHSLYQQIDTIVNKSMQKVADMLSLIEQLEEDIYDTKDIIETWFELKKDMLRMERNLNQTLSIHKTFMKRADFVQNDKKLFMHFEDIEEHLSRMQRNCESNLLKLDGIYNLHTTLANEKMNQKIFALTILSAIFLPANLLVGFFGMNTKGLFFEENPNGTLIVTSIILSVFISIGLFFLIQRKKF